MTEREQGDTVARVDAEALQREALSAIEAASTAAELDDLRVRYLGRRSELKQTLRQVRDRETGMALNAAREAIETAVAGREEALERAELDRSLTEDVVDVTLPGEELPLGRLHPITQVRRIVEDAFLGLGYEVRDDREVEGLAVDRGLTLADLKGTLLHVMRALYGPERRVRFRTHFFPFTEPSIEPDVSCGICGGVGCRTCKYSGWIEMGGAGMVDPRVFENVGVDPEEWTGFAFGCGLERAAQLRHDIPDIRLLWEGDLRFLRQF